VANVVGAAPVVVVDPLATVDRGLLPVDGSVVDNSMELSCDAQPAISNMNVATVRHLDA
jgi:hypothetical protein